MQTVVLILAVFGLLAARLVYVQGVAGDRYAAVGNPQLLHTVVLKPSRGAIYDRLGDPLAVSIPQTTIVADPQLIKDPAREAAQLAPVLGMGQSDLQVKLSTPGQFVYVARQIDDGTAKRVKAMSLPGLSYVGEPKRFLPDGQLASPVLGSVGIDGQGLSGLEYQYDRTLAGRSGRMVLERDPSGADIPGGVRSTDPAQPGKGIVLTLDPAVQYQAEKALSDEIVASKARGGSAIVMNSHSGEILAMASLVAGTQGSPPGEAPNNSAITTVFEPGSVMKSVTIAGALEDHVIAPSTRFSVPDSLTLYDANFHDAETHATEDLSTTDIVAQSSNVGTIEIARSLGKTRVSYYLHDFGFGRGSGLNFPGESEGLLADPSHWSGTAIGAIPIGQDEGVTAIQLLDAYNAIANGGMFVQPKLVKATVGSDGSQDPSAGRTPYRVVSGETAQQLTAMLEQVVQSPSGTGTSAAIPGYTVAGKTGTAQKPLANGRGYQPGAYMASFAGFVPAQDPALTIVVVLDQPTPIFGGAVAAPVFAKIAQYGLRQLAVPPPGSPASSAAPQTVGTAGSVASGRFTD